MNKEILDNNKMNSLNPVHKSRLAQIHWKEFVCGWGSACINITLTYPVNKIIFRQMLHGVKLSNAFRQLRSEGLYYLYRGILPPLCQKTISLSIMFGVYEEVRRPLVEEMLLDPYAAKAVAGIVAGSTEAILVPFERIQTLLSDSAYHKHFRNMFHTFRAIGSQYGIREYYRGLLPILLRNGPSNVCFFIMRDEIHLRMHKSESVMWQTTKEFLCGASIGVTLSTIFYPLNVMKIAMQSRIGGDFENLFSVLRRVYMERGGTFRNFYYGIHANITRAFFSWGVINASYEHIKDLVYKV